MVLFIHAADTHLGFGPNGFVRNLVNDAFHRIVDYAISKQADFMVLSGDIMHVPVPDMSTQIRVFGEFRRLYEAGIQVYGIHGSHDDNGVTVHSNYNGDKSNTTTPRGIIHLLENIGYLNNVYPNGIVDQKTGVLLCGLPGLPNGRDVKYYYMNEGIISSLKKQVINHEGKSIFLFHCAVKEMTTLGEREHMNGILDAAGLPDGFSYYAGGHMHNLVLYEKTSGVFSSYPGVPFAGNAQDLLTFHKNLPRARGFLQVQNESGGKFNAEFIELEQDRHMINVAEGVDSTLIINDAMQSIKADSVVYLVFDGDFHAGDDKELSRRRHILNELRQMCHVIPLYKGQMLANENLVKSLKETVKSGWAGLDIKTSEEIFKSFKLDPKIAQTVFDTLCCITKQDGETKSTFEGRVRGLELPILKEVN